MSDVRKKKEANKKLDAFLGACTFVGLTRSCAPSRARTHGRSA